MGAPRTFGRSWPRTPSGGTVFIARLSPQTIYYRFFTEHPRLGPAERERFTVVDYVERVAFVALLGDEIVAVGRYDQLPNTPVAEVAFVVDDDQHGRGLGSILLEHLAAAARERGLRRFEAEVLTANIKMIRVFRDAGYRIEREVDGDSMRLAFDIEPTEHSVEVMRAREHSAESRSIARLLSPRTIAVIGASRTPGAAGDTVLRNILAGRFPGPVYPVNPRRRRWPRCPPTPRCSTSPNQVDLAVVVTPVGRSTRWSPSAGPGRPMGWSSSPTRRTFRSTAPWPRRRARTGCGWWGPARSG